ncbi:MAG: ArsR family transcriptional regulator [Methanoregula sp.]|nr:ArsR family transcriptional regulator [Methanoregula sp.]
MKTENVRHFTKKEEEFADLLIKIGTRRTVAKVLVFLAKTPEATSRDIEGGTSLNQPEVCLAMRYMGDMNWIKSRDSRSEGRGRPMLVHRLAKPIHEIMERIEHEKMSAANAQLVRVEKLREYIS